MTTRTRPGRARGAAVLFALAGGGLIALTAGCSGGPVGSAFEAERACWKAGRAEQRLGLRPDPNLAAAKPVMAAYESVLARYPLSAAGGNADMRQSLTRSRTLAARRLAGLELATGQSARAGALLWDLRAESLGDLGASVGLYTDLLQILVRGGSVDSLAMVCREIYAKLPAAGPNGQPLAIVLQSPVTCINAYASAGRTAETEVAVAEALGFYDRVAQQNPGTPTEVVALTQKAEVLARARRIPEAVATLERARAVPGVGDYAPAIALALGQLLEQPPANLTRAADAYRGVLRDYPGKPVGLQAGIRLAMVQASTGQPDSALATLDRIVRDNPRDLEGSAQARFQKGLILAQGQRQADAIRELRALATDYPRTRAGLLAPLQAAEYYRAGRDTMAMQATLREAGQNYERLIHDLQSDPAQGPLVMTAMDRLAEVQLRLRDWPDLAQVLQSRAGAFPRDQRSPAALGDAAQILEQKLGDREGSARVLRLLVKRYPSSPLAKAATDRLAQLGGSTGS